MPFTATASRIYYETDGLATGTPLVLIEGLGAQLIGWRAGFVERLVAQGFYVIRLDSRDVGLSAACEAGYALSDTANDVCAVLDALGLASAHVVGQSMGGATAQLLAIDHAERVRSMVLFYTVPVFSPVYLTDEVMQRLAAPSIEAVSRDAVIDDFVENQRFCGSIAYPFEESWIRELAGRSFDRGYRPAGVRRQTAAMIGAPDRSLQLSRLNLPVALIHGRADRLLRYQASIDMAALIPEAELHLFPGMGHQIVEQLWDDLVAIITRTARRAASTTAPAHLDTAG